MDTFIYKKRGRFYPRAWLSSRMLSTAMRNMQWASRYAAYSSTTWTVASNLPIGAASCCFIRSRYMTESHRTEVVWNHKNALR